MLVRTGQQVVRILILSMLIHTDLNTNFKVCLTTTVSLFQQRSVSKKFDRNFTQISSLQLYLTYLSDYPRGLCNIKVDPLHFSSV
jgi:hypothetical protein